MWYFTVLQTSVERHFGILVPIRTYLAMFSMALSSLPRTLYRVSYFVVARQQFRTTTKNISWGKYGNARQCNRLVCRRTAFVSIRR